MLNSAFRSLRRAAIALAAALSAGIALASPAHALDLRDLNLSFDGNNITVSGGGLFYTANTADVATGVTQAAAIAGKIAQEGARVSVESPEGRITPVVGTTPVNEDGSVDLIIYDPLYGGGAPIGTEFSGQEYLLEALPKPADVGHTADGRRVVFPAKGAFTSGFGERWGRHHNGIDIGNDYGTPIRAVMDGTVVNAGPAQGYGNWVVIEHDGGEKSVYGHMAVYDVSVGQRVQAGETIAYIGNEGRSTGPHLHFEIWPDGRTPVDPVIWFAEQGISVHAARQ